MSVWTTWYETKNQLQGEKWKNDKNVEINQHATEQSMGHQGNQRRNKKIAGDKWKQKLQHAKYFGMKPKCF